MLYLPRSYGQSHFLEGLGHYYGLEPLTGRKPTVAQIVALLSTLRRSDVLAWLCSLSGFASQPNAKTPKAQLQLSSQVLSSELHRAYEQLVQKEKHEIGGAGGLFHLQQIWFMVQMAVMCCNEESAQLPSTELSNTLSYCCLMANDVLQDVDSLIRSSCPSEELFDEWCVGSFLPLSEVYGGDELLPRSHNLWFECTKSVRVRKKAAELGIECDLEKAFLDRHHLSLREYVLLLFSLRVHFQGQRLLKPTTPSLLETTTYLTRLFELEFVNKALPKVSQKPEELAIRLLANRQSWSTDISPLREKPLIQVFDNKLCCPDLFLLHRMPIDNVHMLLDEAYPPNKFRELFGFIFEEYVSRLITEFAPSSNLLAKSFYDSPKFEGKQDQACDGILHLNDVIVVMEWKAGRLTARQKYGGTSDELVQAIKDFLASKQKKKGAYQLARGLKRIFDGCKVVATGCQPIDLSSCHAFYPMIVTSEETVGINCVRRVLQKEFDKFLADEVCDTSRIKPLMILTIRDFEYLEAAAKSKPVIEILDEYASYISSNRSVHPTGGFGEFLRLSGIRVSQGVGDGRAVFKSYVEEIAKRDSATGPTDLNSAGFNARVAVDSVEGLLND